MLHLARLTVVREQSMGKKNSCLLFVITLEINGDSVARRKCLFERLVE